MASSVPQDQLHIILNFFEKVQPSPHFPTFFDGMKFIFEYVRKQPSYIVGQLHSNLDPNGLFPWVNYVSFSNGEFPVFSGQITDEWKQVVGKGVGPPGHQVNYPGGYQEIATWSGEQFCPKTPRDENSSFLLIPYKGSDIGESNFANFEAEWKTKSGASIIVDSFPSTLKLGQIGLFRRLQLGRSPLNYVVRCEVLPGSAGAGGAVQAVLDYLPTLREKFSQGNIPAHNVSAYKIAYLCHPNKE